MQGLMICHNHYDNATGDVTGVCVVQADPLIYVSDQMLDNPPSPFVEYGEGILAVRGLNATVRYRLLEHKSGGYWSAQRIDRDTVADHWTTCDYARNDESARSLPGEGSERAEEGEKR